MFEGTAPILRTQTVCVGQHYTMSISLFLFLTVWFWGCDKSLMLLHAMFDSYIAPRDQSVVGSGLPIVKLSQKKVCRTP